MLEIRLLGQIHCVLVGNSRTTIGLIHVKRSGNGPKLRAGTRRDFLICCLLAQSGQAACYPPLPRLRCVGIQFEGVMRSLKAREEIGRQCNEFCCMVD